MAKLRELEPVVKTVLENYPDSRKNDNILILRVLSAMLPEIAQMTFQSVMLCRSQLGLPVDESITRCRRKLQNDFPELRDQHTTDLRVEEQEGYIKYALNLI